MQNSELSRWGWEKIEHVVWKGWDGGEKKGKRRSQVKGSAGDGIKMKGMMKRPGRVREQERRVLRILVVLGMVRLLPTEQGNSSIVVNRVEKAGGLLTLKCSFLNSSFFLLPPPPLLSSLSLSLSLSLPDNRAPSPGCVVMIAIWLPSEELGNGL